ncbi:hypothetical protein STRAU_1388 [Streptomyces aurantiacus JA 4570]|uniref:Uncharacterized protein n=1 Tax=Streptomyces aurantiacus JA 4570 TaxID=1286094 RepID=S4AVU7_9ACTN|nr:hypothetical protein STRAU_1388 [Streptomyces aurantiacus JA 4570]
MGRPAVPLTRHIRHVSTHAATVTEGCCVITNDL